MSKNILIIDDEIDLLTVTKIRLETSGYTVWISESCEDAMELLKKSKPDLILLDLLLPGMQGDTFCKQLKSDPKFNKIPIILFTAYSSQLPQKAKESCANDYILKPFEAKNLLCMIKKHLK